MAGTDSISQGALTGLPAGRPAVAVSGGVDSLRALLECVEAGRAPIAVHALFHNGPDEPAEARLIDGLGRCCAALGAPLRVLDLREAFMERVVRPFVRSYRDGLTPNPCARCNRAMKFGLLMDAALAEGADIFLTGHYARLTRDGLPDGAPPMLGRAADAAKDQSYFLSLVPRTRFSRVAFPLGSTDKETTIRRVREAGLVVPAKKESQEICFVPRGPDHYRDFLEASLREEGLAVPGPGPIVLRGGADSGRVLGRHAGLWRYTEGQRQGLGVSWHEPLYVTGKDAATNTLHVSPRAHARLRGVHVGEVNRMLEDGSVPARALARLRYRQRPAPATITEDNEGLLVILDEPSSPTAPGQVAAVYDETGRVLAGGVIDALL